MGDQPMEQMSPESSGDKETLTSAVNKPDPEVKTFHLKHRFYQCITNTPRTNTVDANIVKLNWFNVPYNDQIFYFTPRVLEEIKLQQLIKVESISFNLHGFKAAYDLQVTVANNVKGDAKPASDPTLWTYIDNKHILPQRDIANMQESDILSNLCMQGNKDNCKFKVWQCKNSTHHDPTGGRPSADPSHWWIWLEDVEHDQIGLWDFPTIKTGRIDETVRLWVNRTYFTGDSLTLTRQADYRIPWGQKVPDCLIKGYPLSTKTDVEIPYTISFWADYEAGVKTRKAKWLYAGRTTNPKKPLGSLSL